MTDTPETKPEEKPKKPKKATLTVVEKTSLDALLEKMNDEVFRYFARKPGFYHAELAW